MQLFRHQVSVCGIYKDFLSHLNIQPSEISKVSDIPFLPIQLFKSKTIISDGLEAMTTFRSSGTSSSVTSEHLVHDLKLYEKSFKTQFEAIYGSCEDLIILALLPSYLERNDSSLVYMVNRLIELTSDTNLSLIHI